MPGSLPGFFMARRKKEALTLSVNPGDKEKLEAIAANLNCYWGDSPSASVLIQELCDGKILAMRPSQGLNRRQGNRLARQLKLLKGAIALIQQALENIMSAVDALEEK